MRITKTLAIVAAVVIGLAAIAPGFLTNAHAALTSN
jgi:hypothetical protein